MAYQLPYYVHAYESRRRAIRSKIFGFSGRHTYLESGYALYCRQVDRLATGVASWDVLTLANRSHILHTSAYRLQHMGMFNYLFYEECIKALV